MCMPKFEKQAPNLRNAAEWNLGVSLFRLFWRFGKFHRCIFYLFAGPFFTHCHTAHRQVYCESGQDYLYSALRRHLRYFIWSNWYCIRGETYRNTLLGFFCVNQLSLYCYKYTTLRWSWLRSRLPTELKHSMSTNCHTEIFCDHVLQPIVRGSWPLQKGVEGRNTGVWLLRCSRGIYDSILIQT